MADAAGRDAYYAYGVDLIRTMGLLLRTTPSVIYRAAMLFQRFEASVDEKFRSKYISAADSESYRVYLEHRMQFIGMENDGSTVLPLIPPEGVEYLVPDHVSLEMKTGLVPLIDLHAPLNYCIHHLIDQEDILFLASACLLIATKMEDPGTRIRAILNVAMRLSQRRLGLPVNDFLKPPPERYEDFKACVVEAEEVVLHQLGFQTSVECPYTYLLIYLGVLVQSNPNKAHPAADGTMPTTSPHYLHWVAEATKLINDFPRCRQLLPIPADVLALFSIQQTCPASVAPQLPPSWTTAFGVTTATMTHVHDIYDAYLNDIGSLRSSVYLAEVRQALPKPVYRTVAAKKAYDVALKEKCKAAAEAKAAEEEERRKAMLDMVELIKPLPKSPPTELGVGSPTAVKQSHQTSPKVEVRASLNANAPDKGTMTSAQSVPDVVGKASAAPTQPPNPHTVAAAPPPVADSIDNMEFEDLREMQKRRRREEKEERERKGERRRVSRSPSPRDSDEERRHRHKSSRRDRGHRSSSRDRGRNHGREGRREGRYHYSQESSKRDRRRR